VTHMQNIEKNILKEHILKELLTIIDVRQLTSQDMADIKFKETLKSKIKKHMACQLDKTQSVNETTLEDVIDEAIGLGPIEKLLINADVSEIMINGHRDIYVEHGGVLKKTKLSFISNASLMAVIKRMLSPTGRRIDETSPMVDARLCDGSRINAIIPPLAMRGPVVTIRKFSKTTLTLHHLIEHQSITKQSAQFLEFAVRHKKNILISGGTGTGKTTFLNAISQAITNNERVITIEDAAELKLNQKHIISLETRSKNIENKGLITIRDLLKNALRMRPDRIIIGECRSEEALDMMQAMNTGHEGSMTTLHANSPKDALIRLETMMLMSGMHMASQAIRNQISSSIDLIIQLSRNALGKRHVSHITEVLHMESSNILTQDLFTFDRNQKRLVSEHKYAKRFKHLDPKYHQELKQLLFGHALPINQL